MGPRDQPTYDLHEVQSLVREGAYRVTRRALFEAARLGMDEAAIIECVLAMTSECFYKTMPARRLAGAWQDVYRPVVDERALYVKLQISRGALLAVVIPFKEK